MRLREKTAAAALLMLAATVLTACGGGDDDGDGRSVGAVDEKAPLYDQLPGEIREAGEIKVGSQLSSPPIVALADDAKTAEGVNVDLAEQLSEELGVEVVFEQSSFDALTPALTSHKIDAIFDMMGDTKERQATFDFVDFMYNGLTYLVAEGNPESVATASDLCGKRVSGVRGTSLVTYAEKASKECQSAGEDPIDLKQFASASDARMQVQNGRSVAFLGQTPNMLYFAENAGGGKTFDAVVDEGYARETIGIAVAKDATQLRDALQKALQNIVDNGDYAEVFEEYGLAELGLEKITVNAGS